MASKKFIVIDHRGPYSGIEVSLIVDKRYERKDGLYNVCVMLYHNRLYHFYQTGFRVKDFSQAGQREQEAAKKKFNEAYELVCDLADMGTFSFEDFKSKIDAPEIETLNGFMRVRIKEYLDKNQYSTAGHYSAALKLFTTVCGEVTFSRVNKEVVSKFKRYMESRPDRYSQSTTLIYLSDLKSCINEALYKKLIKEVNYPFKRNSYERDKIEMPKPTERTNSFLNKDEMMQVFDYYYKTKDEFIGLFLFSYLSGGMNLADVLTLKYNSHYYETEEKEFSYKRKKTEKKNDFSIRVAISDKLREFIPEKSNSDDYVFPYFRDCKTDKERRNKKLTVCNTVNYHLKKMCRDLGFEKDVTPTFARHSFATVLRRQPLEVPESFVEYSMGHSLKGSAKNYFGGFTTEQLLRFSSYLVA